MADKRHRGSKAKRQLKLDREEAARIMDELRREMPNADETHLWNTLLRRLGQGVRQ